MPTGDLPHKRSARALRIAAGDDVAVAVDDLRAGETVCVDGSDVSLREAIARGHKFALRDLATNTVVHKYGFPIGRTTAAVACGAWLHTHNLATQLSGVGVNADAIAARAGVPGPVTPAGAETQTFLGYRRADGRVGTRNEIWVLCSVGCVAQTARRIAEIGATRHAGRVDGVHAYTHVFGCSQLGDWMKTARG